MYTVCKGNIDLTSTKCSNSSISRLPGTLTEGLTPGLKLWRRLPGTMDEGHSPQMVTKCSPCNAWQREVLSRGHGTDVIMFGVHGIVLYN